MPKWIGNRFGDTIPSTGRGAAIKGVFDLFSQYTIKEQGGWVEIAGLMTFSVPSPVETGKVSSGKYTWYEFTASGSFTVTALAPEIAHSDDSTPGNEVAILMVGGGGAGACHHGAGGGGGGLIEACDPNGYGVIDLSPLTVPEAITVKIGAGGAGGGGGINGTSPGIPGQATRFGSAPNPYYLVAYGGGGGGSHNAPSYYSNGQTYSLPTYANDDTGNLPHTFWHPTVPGGTANGNGAGPRTGGCGGGEPWPGPNPNDGGPLPATFGCDGAFPPPHPAGGEGQAGGPGSASQPGASGNSGTYGTGNAGGAASPDHAGGGGGTGEVGNTDGQGHGGDAKATPSNFWSPGHPFAPSPRQWGAGGGGQNNPQGFTGGGGAANPGGGGNAGGGTASGYGNGGGGNRTFGTSGGSGTNGVMYIKVRTTI